MENTLKKNNFKKVLFVIVLALVFAAGIWADKLYNSIQSGKSANPDIALRQSDLGNSTYKFIDPLLACNVSNKKQATEFVPLKTDVQSLIDQKINNGKAETVSLYFDTRDGNWLDINGSQKYSPASLFKVPLAIAYFKQAEADPALLAKKLFYDGRTDLNALEYFKPQKTIQPNQSYSVDDLISRTIGYSDNNAYELLINNIDGNLLNEVYSDLGIVVPPAGASEQEDFITVKQYANFFKVLYNASYLSREMSEKTLSDLSQVDFPQGLKAGLPADIVIAQKFGERDLSGGQDQSGQKELHDCGIIYYPGHPYLLCVMTKGTNFDDLAGTISDISKKVYQYIDQTKAN
jgi:beta-lactamase class A